MPSVASVWPGANWHEREAHDFFGIKFVGHPNLEPFLLPEDSVFHPLRKDYGIGRIPVQFKGAPSSR